MTATTRTETSIQNNNINNMTMTMPSTLQFNNEKVVIVMVGLPARGKSFTSKQIVQHFNNNTTSTTLGSGECRTKIFNAGNLRRQRHGLAGTDASFFDVTNANAKILREQIAMDCLEELLHWVTNNNMSDDSSSWSSSTSTTSSTNMIGILDATNTTVERRKRVVERCTSYDPTIKVLFLECIVNDNKLLEQNYRMKLINEDYKNQDPNVALTDFRNRVQKYEAIYEPLGSCISEQEGVGRRNSTSSSTSDIRYIQVINGGQQLICSSAGGFRGSYVLHQVQQVLENVHMKKIAEKKVQQEQQQRATSYDSSRITMTLVPPPSVIETTSMKRSKSLPLFLEVIKEEDHNNFNDTKEEKKKSESILSPESMEYLISFFTTTMNKDQLYLIGLTCFIMGLFGYVVISSLFLSLNHQLYSMSLVIITLFFLLLSVPQVSSSTSSVTTKGGEGGMMSMIDDSSICSSSSRDENDEDCYYYHDDNDEEEPYYY